MSRLRLFSSKLERITVKGGLEDLRAQSEAFPYRFPVNFRVCGLHLTIAVLKCSAPYEEHMLPSTRTL